MKDCDRGDCRDYLQVLNQREVADSVVSTAAEPWETSAEWRLVGPVASKIKRSGTASRA